MLRGDKGRQELELELANILEQLNYSTNIRLEILNYFNSKNYSKLLALKMISEPSYLSTITDMDLCLLCIKAYEYLKMGSLNPENYFTKNELNLAKTYKREKEINDSTEIILTNVFKKNEDEYVCPVVPIQAIGDIIDRGLYTYDFTAQRQPNKKARREKISKTPTIIPSKRHGIAKTIIDKKPLGNDTIILNVPTTGAEKFEFSDNVLKITIDDNTRLTVNDGFHRWVASSDVLYSDPDFYYNFSFKIYHYPEDLIREAVLNIDKQTKFSELHVKNISKENVYMVMANEINKYGDKSINSLYDRLGEDVFDIENGNAYTTLSIFGDAIDYNFNNIVNSKTETSKSFERSKIKKFIIDGFIYIIGACENDFNNRKNIKNLKVSVHPNIFVGYVALLSKLYGDVDWENKLLKVLTEIDFNAENKIWNEIGLFGEKLNKTKMKSISHYFKSLI